MKTRPSSSAHFLCLVLTLLAHPSTAHSQTVTKEQRDSHVAAMREFSYRAKPLRDTTGQVERDLATWIAANPNDVEATYFLALRLGVGANDRGFELLTRSSESGFLPAQARLGYVKLREAKDPADRAVGVELLRKSMAGGEPTGMAYLGVAALRGISPVEKDLQFAIKHLRRAVDLGDERSRYDLASALLESDRIEEATTELLKSANAGEPRSMLAWASWREKGYLQPRNEKEAYDWVSRAAALNETDAHRAYREQGRMLRDGIGTKADAEKAVEVFRMGMRVGDTGSITGLALCYLRGEGIEMDIEEGLKLLRHSASTADSDALFELGRAHLNGLWVKRDPVQGFLFLEKAANQGHREALHYQKSLSGLPATRPSKSQ